MHKWTTCSLATIPVVITMVVATVITMVVATVVAMALTMPQSWPWHDGHAVVEAMSRRACYGGGHGTTAMLWWMPWRWPCDLILNDPNTDKRDSPSDTPSLPLHMQWNLVGQHDNGGHGTTALAMEVTGYGRASHGVGQRMSDTCLGLCGNHH
jgi:hypothetical protein